FALLVLFLLSGSGAPRSLLSFPTRRSSDLACPSSCLDTVCRLSADTVKASCRAVRLVTAASLDSPVHADFIFATRLLKFDVRSLNALVIFVVVASAGR